MSSLVVGICGRTGSGKSTMAKRLMQALSATTTVQVLSMDDFYRELTDSDHELALRNEFDFDTLDSFDLAALRNTINCAKENRGPVSYHRYDHASHKHKSDATVLQPAKVWIVEGLYLFAVKDLVPLFDFKVFMDIGADVSLLRRVRRDIVYRRRNVEGVLAQYERYVKPAYDLLVKPARDVADVCVMRGALNEPAFSAVMHHILSQLKQ